MVWFISIYITHVKNWQLCYCVRVVLTLVALNCHQVWKHIFDNLWQSWRAIRLLKVVLTTLADTVLTLSHSWQHRAVTILHCYIMNVSVSSLKQLLYAWSVLTLVTSCYNSLLSIGFNRSNFVTTVIISSGLLRVVKRLFSIRFPRVNTVFKSLAPKR